MTKTVTFEHLGRMVTKVGSGRVITLCGNLVTLAPNVRFTHKNARRLLDYVCPVLVAQELGDL